MWECNIKPNDIEKIFKTSLVSTAHSICKAWASYNYREVLEDPIEVLDATLVYNSLIRRANMPITDKNWTYKNITKVWHIWYFDQKRYYTHEELMMEYDMRVDMLRYNSLKMAIPPIWKHIIKNCEIEQIVDREPPWSIIGRPFTRHMYWSLLEKRYLMSEHAMLSWEKDLGQSELEYTNQDIANLFVETKEQVRIPKLWLLQYRILTSTITTNVKRNKWNNSVSKLCAFCNEIPETMLHLFFDCKEVKVLWTKLENWIEHFLNIVINLDSKVIMLNNYSGPSKEIVNTLIVITKQYIYSSKCEGNKIEMINLINKFVYWFKVEQIAVSNTKQYKKFCKKWNHMF